MELTARHLNRATLARQLLLERIDVDVVEAVHRVCALQGQEPAAPYVALAARVDGFDPRALDEALRSMRLLRATLMRVTLHVVAAADHTPYRAAMAGRIRASRVADRRFRDAGLVAEQADEAVPGLLELLSTPRRPDEVRDHLATAAGADAARWLWWALRTYAPVVRAPEDAPWSFGRTTPYVRAPRAAGDGVDPSAGVAHLVRRHLAAFGPATVADAARFTGLTRSSVVGALDRLGDELVTHTGPGGSTMLDLAGAPLPDPTTPAPPRLLGMWECSLLAHDDRTRVLPDEVRRLVIRRNGDTLATVLVDGRVRGVWRQVDDGIEVAPLAPIADETWEELAGEAARLVELFDGRPRLFGRYDRWWAGERLPTAGRQVLPA